MTFQSLTGFNLTASGTKVSALTAVTTPAGTDEIPVNQGGTSKKLTLTQVNAYAEPVSVAATAAQTPAANTDVYIINSGIAIPETRIQAGTMLIWKIFVSKTAAGTAAPVWNIRHGTGKATSDTSRCAITTGAQAATANTGVCLDVMATFRSVGASTSAVLQGGVAGSITGFPTNGAVATSSGFNSTTTGTWIGLSVNTGASAAWTITQVMGYLLNIT